jgi:hypothetical protein
VHAQNQSGSRHGRHFRPGRKPRQPGPWPHTWESERPLAWGAALAASAPARPGASGGRKPAGMPIGLLREWRISRGASGRGGGALSYRPWQPPGVSPPCLRVARLLPRRPRPQPGRPVSAAGSSGQHVLWAGIAPKKCGFGFASLFSGSCSCRQQAASGRAGSNSPWPRASYALLIQAGPAAYGPGCAPASAARAAAAWWRLAIANPADISSICTAEFALPGCCSAAPASSSSS